VAAKRLQIIKVALSAIQRERRLNSREREEWRRWRKTRALVSASTRSNWRAYQKNQAKSGGTGIAALKGSEMSARVGSGWHLGDDGDIIFIRQKSSDGAAAANGAALLRLCDSAGCWQHRRRCGKRRQARRWRCGEEKWHHQPAGGRTHPAYQQKHSPAGKIRRGGISRRKCRRQAMVQMVAGDDISSRRRLASQRDSGGWLAAGMRKKAAAYQRHQASKATNINGVTLVARSA
jgi:hypothetical protein